MDVVNWFTAGMAIGFALGVGVGMIIGVAM